VLRNQCRFPKEGIGSDSPNRQGKQKIYGGALTWQRNHKRKRPGSACRGTIKDSGEAEGAGLSPTAPQEKRKGGKNEKN